MISKIILILILHPLILFSQTNDKRRMGLDDVIRIAAENNITIKSSMLNIKKENAAKQRSFNIPKPELFVEYEGVNGDLSDAGSRKIGILQEIEFPTNYFLRSDMQSAQVKVAEDELKSALNSVTTDIKINYYRLLYLTELLANANANFKIYNDFLFTAEKNYEAGVTSNLEVLGAKVSKIKFENEIKNLESEIRSSQTELRNLMNVDYDILPGDDFTFEELKLSKPEVLKSAAANNPGLSVHKALKEKFSNKNSLAKGEVLPDISFKYFRQKIAGENNYWGMEIGLGVPLWFWWEQSGSINESNYEHQIAANEELEFKKTLEKEIEVAFDNYENNLRQVKFFSDEALKESEEILRQSKISYDEGAIGYVEYLQALNIAYETKTQYLNSIFGYYQSIIKLENLSGGELR